MKKPSDRGHRAEGKRPWSENEGLTAEQRCRKVLLREIDDWRRQQADLPSRPEAMRRLLVRALKSSVV